VALGAVAAGHRLPARAGAEILAAGGNAFDAALAAAFAAAVAEGALTGPAAGGFMMACPVGRSPVLLDFFVVAPGLGPSGRRLDPDELGTFVVPFGGAEQAFHHGPASVAVPGMTAGLLEAHSRWCRLPLADLVAPAARAAREGVVVTAEVAFVHEILTDMFTFTPECAAIYAPDGRMLGEGETLRNPDLADTLELIAAGGADELTGAILSLQREIGGHITAEDLDDYRVMARTPLQARFRDTRLLTNPPPSSGGVLVCAALRYLESTGEHRHYCGATAAGVYANSLRHEDFLDFLHEPQAAEALLEAPLPSTRKPTGSTTHVSAIDAEGNIASLSSSNGAGSGIVVPGTGVILNNMMGEQDLNPAGFGLVPPGRRMNSMMAPSVLLGPHRSVALGSAGSNRLRSAILQVVMSVVDDRLPLNRAVARPRVHPEGDGVDVEGGVPEAAVAALEAEGHSLRRWGAMNLFFGGVSAVARADGEFSGAGDPRRGGRAVLVSDAGELVEL
jgi:gamma-glutamyltranspeptidase/glutathione hydrolase